MFKQIPILSPTILISRLDILNYIMAKALSEPRPQNKSKAKALLIGITYIHSENDVAPLSNSGKSVRTFEKFLKETYQFQEEDVVVMTDDFPEVPQDLQPTRANILYQLSQFVKDARPGDTFIFLCAFADAFGTVIVRLICKHMLAAADVGRTDRLPSHHLRDEHNDMHETIITMDHHGITNGFILDFELKEALLKTLQKNPRPLLDELVMSLSRHNSSPFATIDSHDGDKILHDAPLRQEEAVNDDSIQISSTLPITLSDSFTLGPISVPENDFHAEITRLQTEAKMREEVIADMKAQHIKETSHLHEQIKNLSTTLVESKATLEKERKAFQEQIANSNRTSTELKADAIKAKEGLAAVMQSVQMIVDRASSTCDDVVPKDSASRSL
ncbi:Ca(2+)-dependent cysteine protease [Steccherinum ochraceum]|uniref:Ca(2+)-dependent cysteine protease n=1 Tax=Steccherinum ochraceum TaxID=92696 RepID=A0A4R0RL23_9APHY|nr:Ca(2+)-dependent cysteine protease [Steccherinum ochraceum]